MARRLKHTRIKNGKLQLFVRVHPGPGGLKTKTVPRNTTAAEIDAWVQQQKDYKGVDGGLRETVVTYLQLRSAMPTLAQHTAHLELWVHALGADRPPMGVTSNEITAVIDRWMREGLANDTIRKRRSALRTFYKRTYPKLLSPVAGSLNPKAPKVEARELAYADIDAAIASMPTYRDTKPGTPKQLSMAKVVLRLMADTGFPPGVIGHIRPDDWNFAAGTVRVVGREKGEGVEARTLPLTVEGLRAAKAFHAAHAYGPYSDGRINAMGRSFKRACERIGLPMRGVTQYILRHSFLATYYRVTKDEATVQRVGLHAPGSRCTARYTEAAHAEVDRAAAKAVSQARARLKKVAQKLPRRKVA